MPGQVQLATNLAAQNYYNGLPGQSAAATAIGRNSANSFYQGSQGASSGTDLLDLAAKLNQNTDVATNDLATKAAAYKADALGGYQNALGQEAGWQDKLYRNNVLEPYLRIANTAAAMYGAGSQNEFSGLDQVATAGVGYVQNINPAPYGSPNGSELPPAQQAGFYNPPLSNPTSFSQEMSKNLLKKSGL